MIFNRILYIFISMLYSLTVLVSAGDSDSSILYNTVITTEENLSQSILLSYVNSTSLISSISFLKLHGKNIANVSKNSELTMYNCEVSYEQASSSLFISSGKITLNNFALIKNFNYPSITLPTFVDISVICAYSPSSCVNFQNSEICNAAIKRSEGTLLSKGNISYQNVKNCHFYNLTIFDKKEEKIEDENTAVSFCIMSGTNMERVDDFIYGSIISGLTLKTRCNFECNNNTFNNCHRRSNPNSYNKYYLKKEIKSKKDKGNNNKNKNKNNNNMKDKNDITEYTDQSFDNKNKAERDVSSSFTRCNFTDCIADGDAYEKLDYGGALYGSKSSVSLSIISCLFNNCSADRHGGAIYCENISQLTCFSSNFTLCLVKKHFNGRCGCIYIDNVETCCEVNLCIFANSSSSGSGGAVLIGNVNVTDCSEYSPCSEGPINNCLFDNCSSDGNGGAMNFDRTTNIYIYRNLTFKNCYAESVGGGFYCDGAKKGSFIDFIFENNKVSDPFGGCDVNLHYYYTDEVNPFVSSYSSSGPYRVCITSVSNDYHKHFIDAWLPPFAKYVKSDGKNEEGCGSEDNPCLTIDFLVEKASEVNASNYFLSILHDLYVLDGEIKEIHESSLFEHELTLIGRSKENSKVSVTSSNFDGSCLFSLSNGTISVKDLTLLINSNFDKSIIYMNDSGTIEINNLLLSSSVSNDYSGTLIDASAGKVQMENVEFNSYNFSSTAKFLKCSDTVVFLSSISFVNINIERMTDSAVYCSFGDESYLTLTDVTVRSSNLKESIPLIKLYINGTLNSTVLNNITYENTQESSGVLLAFVCSKKEYIPPLSSWTEIAPTLEVSNEYYYKVELEEKNITFAYVHYLYDVIKNEEDEYVLYSDGNGGLSVDNCGWKDLPCENLDIKYNNYVGKRRVIINRNCLMTSIFENVENELFIEGEDLESTVSGLIFSQTETEADYYFSINNSNIHLNFTKVMFIFDDYYKVNISNMNEIVSATNGRLSFYNCYISPSLPISFAKINISSSSSSFGISLCLQNIEYHSSDISLLYSPYTESTSNSLTLSLNISNVTNSAPLNSLSNESSSSSSSIISLNIDHSYIIKGNISSSSENCLNGGAICCTLKEDGTIHLTDLSVSDCKASVSKEEGKEGRGGFLYLDCSEKDVGSFVFHTSLDIGGGNDATYGKNFFIKGNNFYNSIKKEDFPFIYLLNPSFENNMNEYVGIDKIYTSEVDLLYFLLQYSSESIYVSNTERSYDVIGCGSDDVPCRSINYGMNNLKEGEKKNIIVKDEVEIDRSLDLSDIVLSSSDISEKSLCLFSSTVKMEDVMFCSILNLDKLSLSGLHFPLFSSFSDETNSVFISAFISSTGELSIENCEFSLSPSSPENTIRYTIISIVDGNLTIDLLNINHLSLYESFSIISFEKSSEFESNSYLKDNKMRHLNGGFDDVYSELKRNEEEYDNHIVIRTSMFNNISKNENKPSFLNIKKIEEKLLLLLVDNTSFIQGTSNKINAYAYSCEYCDCNISFSSFSGVSSDEVLKWNSDEELIGTICDWNEGMIVFAGGNVNIKDTSIINSSLGGLSVNGGSKLSLDNILFDNNKKIAEGYKSARKNIVCESSSINLISLKEEKEVKLKRSRNEVKESLWILNKECESEGLLTEYPSSFFIPSLNTVSYSSDDIDDIYLMNFTGTNLMPCNLSFEIRIRKEEGLEYRSLFGEIVRYFNETCCEGKFNAGDVGMWKAGDYLSVILHYGSNEGGGEEGEYPVQNTKKTSSVNVGRIVWILASVILFLLLVLAACLITYLCCYLNPNIVKWREDRKRRGKKREHYDEIEDMLKKGNKEMGKDNMIESYDYVKDDNKVGKLDNIGTVNSTRGDNNMDDSSYPSYTAPQM